MTVTVSILSLSSSETLDGLHCGFHTAWYFKAITTKVAGEHAGQTSCYTALTFHCQKDHSTSKT